MKTSGATSAKATGRPRPTGRSSARRHTPITAEVLALTGPSDLPDPSSYAYRKDLADIALAGRVIASHYAEPLPRVLAHAAVLRSAASEEAGAICELQAGDPFELLDNSIGWAWGYGGTDRIVGYVKSDTLLPLPAREA